MQLIIDFFNPKTKKLGTPTESSSGNWNSADASCKKVAQLMKYKRAGKTED